MVDVRQVREHPIQVFEGRDFVEMRDVGENADHEPAVEVHGIDNHVIAIESGTPFAPEFRDEDGEPLDPSTQFRIQKADPQRNPLGGHIIAEGTLGQFDYEKMRSDEDYLHGTNRPVMLDEKEHVFIYVMTPEGTSTFSAESSRLTIGDSVTDLGKPAYVTNKKNLSEEEHAAVNSASTGGV